MTHEIASYYFLELCTIMLRVLINLKVTSGNSFDTKLILHKIFEDINILKNDYEIDRRYYVFNQTRTDLYI